MACLIAGLVLAALIRGATSQICIPDLPASFGYSCPDAGTFCDIYQCAPYVTTDGGSCTGTNDPVTQCGGPSGGALFPYQSGGTCTCLKEVGEGNTCGGTYAPPCSSPLLCANGICRAQTTTVGGSCGALQGQCGVESASRAVLYCQTGVSGQHTCQPMSTSAGQTCGPDSDACSTSAGLYCVASTQLCARKATTVGASCSFDVAYGCASTSAGDALYCRKSDATCQLSLTTIGADCRADPVASCATATAPDGTTTPLYCSLPSFHCAAKLGTGASCGSNPSQACLDSLYCSSNTETCVSRTTTNTGSCNADPYAQCGIDQKAIRPGYSGQLYPSVYRSIDGNQICVCYELAAPAAQVPPQGAFGLTTVGDDCSADPTFSCGYTAAGVKLYCASSTGTCQQHVTMVGGSCAYDYLGACGITTDGSYTQLFPSIPVGSSGHADCTCVTQAGVVVRPSSRARSRRNLSLCPWSQTACPIGSGFECIDTENDFEQCGGCTQSGGVDCTALRGVAAVGCVGGRCEVWACDIGYSFDSVEGICVEV